MDNIGNIIRNHRMVKDMTQEELGKKVFVSKQAVSKWETGKTTPDIETIRKLCEILEINKDEILGGTIEEVKNKRKWLKVCVVITILCFLMSAFFYAAGGVEFIKHYTQASVCFISVFSNGEALSSNEYTITSDSNWKNLENGYKTHIDYGEICGVIHMSNGYEIEFGFVNINKWHNVQIRLDVEQLDNQVLVRQTVSYETESNLFEVFVTQSPIVENSVSVYRGGI